MKPDQTSASITDTALSQLNLGGNQAVLTTSTVAVAVSAHALMHISLLIGVVAIVLLRPRDALCALFGVFILLGGVFYVALKREDPSDYGTRALANLNNALAFRTLIPAEIKPVKPEAGPKRDAYRPRSGNLPRSAAPVREPAAQSPAPEPAVAAPEPELSPLPPASGAARNEEEPMYWGLVHDRMPASVPPQARGRHRRAAKAGTAAAPADDQEQALLVTVSTGQRVRSLTPS